ncbi:MAG: FHA domain-containing protein [Planctomycetota bacterium]|nr:FHA domain-containing protein [Planctomycetota bacterium]
MPKIFVLTGPDVGHSCDVEAGALFGRADDCVVRLKDASISRHHARLERTAAGWSVVDLGSRNGVFWDGERVERVTLEEGREFTLGEVVLKFRDGALPKRYASPATQITTAAQASLEDEEIVLEGEWDDAKAAANVLPTATAFAPRAKPTEHGFGAHAAPAEQAQPSLARRQATEKLAAAGALPTQSKIGARGVLQYGKVESRDGFMQSDFDQQPLWIKFLILLVVLVVVAGVSWLAFRAVILLRGSPTDPPAIEESVEEAK